MITVVSTEDRNEAENVKRKPDLIYSFNVPAALQ
jgi:hypothetical protein